MASALKSHGPLEGRPLPVGDRFTIRLAPRSARLLLRGSSEVAAATGAVFGAAPATKPRTVGAKDGRAALWLGPDEWLLIAEGEAPDALKAEIVTALAALPHSLVDISQRQLGLTLTGAVVVRALNAGCPLDLSERAFPVGEATRTMLSKAEAVLWRRGPETFHLEIWRSFADYAVSFLTEAALRAP